MKVLSFPFNLIVNDQVLQCKYPKSDHEDELPSNNSGGETV